MLLEVTYRAEVLLLLTQTPGPPQPPLGGQLVPAGHSPVHSVIRNDSSSVDEGHLEHVTNRLDFHK